MENLNKKYELQIEVLTPLHVGAGAEKDWVQGCDFLVDNNQVKILNLKKVSQHVNIADLSNALLRKDDKELKAKLADNIDVCVEKKFDCKYFGTNDIKTFIKNGLTNNPIVPGSSLKGAIRSILLQYLMTDFVKTDALKTKRLDEKEIFGKANIGDEFLRFIKVSDAEFVTSDLVNTKIFNLISPNEGGWKHGGNTTNLFKPDGFNTFYEVVNPKQNSTLSISIADKAFNNFAKKNASFSSKKTKLINEDLSFLFELINMHTKAYLEKEKAFFVKYATEKTDLIVENINSLIKQIPTQGECCILKMAAGSGFHSITGDWQFDDYSVDKLFYEEEKWGKIKTVSRGLQKGKKSAKSRKIAISGNGDFSLMGFIKLKVMSEDEIKLQNEAKAIIQKELEEKRFAEEKAKAEESRIQKEAAEANLAEKQRLIDEAKRIEEEKIAEKKRLVDLEISLFEKAKTIKSIESCNEYLNNFPLSLRKDEIETLLRSLVAVSNIPENITNKDNFKQFANNTDNWVKKITKEGKTIHSLGFEEEFIQHIVKIAKVEILDSKTSKSWSDGTNQKKIGQWLGEEKAKGIISSLK